VPLDSVVRNTVTAAQVQLTVRRDRVLEEWEGIVLLDSVARNMDIVVVARISAPQLWAVGLGQRVLLDCVVANGAIAVRDQIIVVLDPMRVCVLVGRYLTTSIVELSWVWDCYWETGI